MAKVSAPLLLGVGAIALLASRKRGSGSGLGPGRMRNGVFSSADCKTLRVADYDRFNNFMRGGFAELRASGANLDNYAITDRMFRDTAPGCTGFPGVPESADVVMLYMTMMRMVAYQLVEERIANAIDIISDERNAALTAWVNEYGGGPPNELPGNVPEDQVGFSPNYKQRFVGPAWVANTLEPFMASEGQGGRFGDDAYDRFVNGHNVMVGTSFVPIVELPMNEAKVAEFLDRILEAASQQG